MAIPTLFETHPEVERRFPELHAALKPQQAMIESNRCLNCFDAPCTAACPTHIDVPKFIKKIASGNVRGSARSILEANVLAASCSRVCPVEVLCEGACVMHGLGEEPIAIGRLQRFAMDEFYAGGGQIAKRCTPERPERVACIGAGPASLACAAELRQQGIQVTVFDRRVLPGGLNTYGVAEYKLKTVESLREIEQIRRLGVEFRTEEVAEDSDLERLEESFDAIFLGVGLGAMHRLGVPGDESAGVVDALEFVADYKTGRRLEAGRSVVVVGAGNTAIDAAVAARRLGAENVHIVYRRARPNISAFDFEFEHAQQEGVGFLWWTLPVAVQAGTHGVTGLECVRVEMEDGRFVPVVGTNFVLQCDMVIPAIGQSPLLEFLSKLRGLQVENGRVVVDRGTGQTTSAKYFAGGDCVNGGREVVDAVADGKRAALGIVSAFGATKEVVHG